MLQGQGRKKVLQGLNAVTWFNKDVAKVLQCCNKIVKGVTDEKNRYTNRLRKRQTL